MPIYALICHKCKDEWEDVHPMTAEHPKCRKGCGCRCDTNPSKQVPRRERHFAGSERMSLKYAFDATEAAEARQEFAGTGAEIADDGSVYFDTRSQERAFSKRFEQIAEQSRSPHPPKG